MSALSSELWIGFWVSKIREGGILFGFHTQFFVHVDECGAGGMGGVVVVYGLCGSGVV